MALIIIVYRLFFVNLGSRKTQRGSFGDLTSSNNQIRLDRVGSGKRSVRFDKTFYLEK
jgi:hypothetical protein